MRSPPAGVLPRFLVQSTGFPPPETGVRLSEISAKAAWLPSEIHCFWPVIRQPPSSRCARVDRFAASEPVSGSVRPKQPIASPVHRPGSSRCFCSSDPQRAIAEPTSDVLTETTVRTEESARPISSTISA